VASFAEFLNDLLLEGEISLRGAPSPSQSDREEARIVLEKAYATYRLHVAGPLLEFAQATALAAGELIWWAAWYLASHEQPPSELQSKLKMPGAPRDPGQHLSADLLLRYLPQIYQRALALDPADELCKALSDLLRQWPLSGVLADLDEPPVTAIDFGHHGLQLLYSERLQRNQRANWQPQGNAQQYVELVRQALIQQGA
jgi:hypothetical protein